MTDRRNGRKGMGSKLLMFSVAALFVLAAPDVSAAAAKRTWLSRAFGVAGSAMNALLLKKNLEKRQGELFGLLDDSLDAFKKGDKRKLDAAWREAEKIPGKLLVDQSPVLKVGAAVKRRIQNAKRRIKGWFGGDGESAVDPGAALAVNKSERKLLGSRRLPVGRAKLATKPVPKFSFNKWVEEERRARPHCYGAVSDETAAECDRESWGGKRKASKTGGGNNKDEWGAEGGDQASGKKQKDVWGVVDEADDGGREPSEKKPAGDEPDDGRKDYEAAVAHAVGDNPEASESKGYQALLSDMEEKERKAKEDAERKAAAERKAREDAERRRLKEERLAKQEAEKKAAEWPAGKVFSDCPDCPEMVEVPAGTFMMGSPPDEEGRGEDEGPRHRVTIASPFAVGKYEVTFSEWDACVEGGGCGGYRPDDSGLGRVRRPVINVSWADAQAYVRWLSKKTGKRYRLLSESEWEYAARAGTTTRYSWGDDIGRNRANCYGCGSRWEYERTAPVGSFAANGFGLYDMHGNVGEWVEDCWNGNYRGAPSDGSAWMSDDCSFRVLRGGSWGSHPRLLRTAYRDRVEDGAGYRCGYCGFRVARTLGP